MEDTEFTFHTRWADALKNAPPAVRLEVYEAVAAYAATRVEPDLRSLASAYFSFIRQDMDKDFACLRQPGETMQKQPDRYLEGRLSENTETKTNQTESRNNQTGGKEEESKNCTQQINNNNNNILEDNSMEDSGKKKKGSAEGKRKETRFTPPTIDEVTEYVREKAYTFSPERFHAYYQSNGWRVGRNPMKDWKAACRTWQTKENESNQYHPIHHAANAADTIRETVL